MLVIIPIFVICIIKKLARKVKTFEETDIVWILTLKIPKKKEVSMQTVNNL